MNDFYKNPILYYIAIPLLVAAWPILTWYKTLPQAIDSSNKWQGYVQKSEPLMVEILQLDPDRADPANAQQSSEEFDFVRAMDRVARLCRIPTQNTDPSAQDPIGGGNKPKTQRARMSLNRISIEQVAQFVSTIRMQWPGLECIKISLDYNEGTKDNWDIDLEFKYYF
ncbi:hypothetical protein ACFL3F_00465 [Planctomycetota bacterium]